MKNWRDRNPEKMEEANRKRRESGFVLARGTSARTETFFGEIAQESLQKNMETHYKIYQRSVRLKKLQFTFSEEEFKELVVKPCYYCNIVEEKGFNGIDRMNQTEGYIQSNGVSCCAMCNWLKGSLDSATFIKRTRHIHSFKNGLPDERFPECFPDAKCVSYASYRSRAEKKSLEFAITHDEYKTLIQQDCYLCGKPLTDTNINGVDRVNNSVGYILENCKACCKECNHMKNSYGLEEFLEKIERIQNHWNNRDLPLLPVQIHSIVQMAEKMTKEEIEKEREARKQRALKKHQDYLHNIETK
jgi:hypothetical protein